MVWGEPEGRADRSWSPSSATGREGFRLCQLPQNWGISRSMILGTSPRGPRTACHRWLFVSAQVPAGTGASRLGHEEREAGQREGAQGEKRKEPAFAHSPPRPHPGLALWGRALLSFPELSSRSAGRGEGLSLANLSNPPPLGAASRLAQASESLVQELFIQRKK